MKVDYFSFTRVCDKYFKLGAMNPTYLESASERPSK